MTVQITTVRVSGRRYTIILEPDPEEGGYVVSVPSLPGCFTQGSTRTQAITRAREAIACHLIEPNSAS